MIDFDEMINNYLKREERKKQIGRYYPSEIGGCLRKIWFSYKFPKKLDPETIKIFEMGNILHEFVVDVLKSEKNPHIELKEAEKPFKMEINGFTISGRIDNIIFLKSDNETVLVEVKSTSDVNNLVKAKKEHQMQLQLYMFAINIRKGLLLYLDKKKLRSKVFTVKYDELEALHALERFSTLHKHLTSGKVPIAEAKKHPRKSWLCNYCEYKKLCGEYENE